MANVKTAEELAQCALDLGIVEDAQLQSVWSQLGTRAVSLHDFQQALLRADLLTNYQLDRIMRGLRSGFFYGDYKVQYCVGSGTFARVFRATRKGSDGLFAVKVLRNRYSDKPQDAELFRREGRLGSTLHHPNIVPIHEVVSKGLTHYLVMDFIEGRNLREFYKIRKKCDPLEAAQIIADILAGLNYAFQKGITHRDIKMSNVIIASGGGAKLLDFGLAALDAGDVGGEAGVNPRTVDYAGLERATGVRKDDTRSDIFFTGCILYQLLAGRPPLSETKDRAQRLSKSRYQNIPPILEVSRSVPLGLAMVVNRAVEFDPARRYQTPADMLVDLRIALKRLDGNGQDADDSKRDLESEEGLNEDGESRRLMVVESDGKMQDVFRDLFKRNGYRVLVSSDPEKVLQRFIDDRQAADVVLFNTISIGRPAFEVFNRFANESITQDIPAILLLGEQHHAWESRAQTAEHRLVLKMPVKPKMLREALVQLAKRSVSPSP